MKQPLWVFHRAFSSVAPALSFTWNTETNSHRKLQSGRSLSPQQPAFLPQLRIWIGKFEFGITPFFMWWKRKMQLLCVCGRNTSTGHHNDGTNLSVCLFLWLLLWYKPYQRLKILLKWHLRAPCPNDCTCWYGLIWPDWKSGSCLCVKFCPFSLWTALFVWNRLLVGGFLVTDYKRNVCVEKLYSE